MPARRLQYLQSLGNKDESQEHARLLTMRTRKSFRYGDGGWLKSAPTLQP